MEVGFTIVGVVIDLTVATVGRQLGYIFGYRRNVEELKSKIEDLEDDRDNLQRSVDASMRKGEEIVDGVKKWLERVNVISGEVKRFQDDECHSITVCNNWSCPNLWSHRRLSRKAKKMVGTIAEIQGKYIIQYHVVQVGFRGLENLDLSVFPECENIWQNLHQLSSFCNLKSIVMERCEVSTAVISSTLLFLLNSLEELEVENCDSVEVVFDIEEMRGQVMEHTLAVTKLKKLTLSCLSNLKHVWNKDPKGMISFQNLQNVKVFECQSLRNLFPLTVAKGLLQLKELDIELSGIEEIVAMEERLVEFEMDNFGVENRELQEAEFEATVNFVFPSVDYLRLWQLRKLKSFYPGKYTLYWPMLKYLDMHICSDVCLLSSELSTFHDARQEDGFGSADQRSLFLVEKVIPKLELSLHCQDAVTNWLAQFPVYLFSSLRLLRIQFFDYDQASFPYRYLQKIPHLQSLIVKFSSFRELFPDESSTVLERQNGTFVQVQLKALILRRSYELDNICKEGSQLDPLLGKLEDLCVRQCSSLTRLVPSSVSLSYLRCLEVTGCHGLFKLLVSSTVKSLVKLETLTVCDCDLIEEIIADEGHEADEIELGQWKVLELLNLPNLTIFCSASHAFRFPNLEIVSVKGCPMMQTFSSGVSSAPKLQNILVEETDDEWCWEGTLNVTIKKLYNYRCH